MFDLKLVTVLALLLVNLYVSCSCYNDSYPEDGCGKLNEGCGEALPMGYSLCLTNQKERRPVKLVCYLKADELSNETEKTVEVNYVYVTLWNKLWTVKGKIVSTIRKVIVSIACAIGRFCLCILNTLYCIVYILVSVVKGLILSFLWIVAKIFYAVWISIDFALKAILKPFSLWRKLIGEVTCPNMCNIQRWSSEGDCGMQGSCANLWDSRQETICSMGFSCGHQYGYVCPTDCIDVLKDCLCGLIHSICRCIWDFFLGILSLLSKLLMWSDPPRSIWCIINDFFEDLYNLFYNLISSFLKAFKKAWEKFQAFRKRHCKRQDSAFRRFMKKMCLGLKQCIDKVYNVLKKFSPCEPPRRSYYCYD